jgi:hypothetical protein
MVAMAVTRVGITAGVGVGKGPPAALIVELSSTKMLNCGVDSNYEGGPM